MSSQLVPLNGAPNQQLAVTLNINGGNLSLNLLQYYNRYGGFWCLDIYSAAAVPLVTSVPLITGDWPGGNILSPYGYMNIGQAFLINQDAAITDFPNAANLASGYSLLWTDNDGSGVAPGYPTAPVVPESGDWSSYPVALIANYL